jgi:hypothetical protein
VYVVIKDHWVKVLYAEEHKWSDHFEKAEMFLQIKSYFIFESSFIILQV